MTDYTKNTNFTAKDSLLTGDPNKLVKGSDMDTEFEEIASASATKANLAIPAATNNVALLSGAGHLVDSTVTTGELSLLVGATLTTAELNLIDGVTATTVELNYVDGVTSNVQTQLNAITADDWVTQARVADSAIGQGQLKSAAADQSFSALANAQTDLALTGADYTMNWFMSAASGENRGVGVIGPMNDDGASYTDQVGVYNGNNSAITVYTTSRYIQASPPYDLGDGEIQLFVSIIVDPLGVIKGVSVAPDPHWAYHGDTSIIANHYNAAGIGFRKDLILPAGGDVKAAMNNPALLEQFIDAQRNPQYLMVELTQAVKNADKEQEPHCWKSVDPADTVIMLDPVSPIMEGLRIMHDQGESIVKLIEDGYVAFDNTEIVRGMPSQLMAVTPSWRAAGGRV